MGKNTKFWLIQILISIPFNILLIFCISKLTFNFVLAIIGLTVSLTFIYRFRIEKEIKELERLTIPNLKQNVDFVLNRTKDINQLKMARYELHHKEIELSRKKSSNKSITDIFFILAALIGILEFLKYLFV